jgi:RND family efflux transporter MFP subunit
MNINNTINSNVSQKSIFIIKALLLSFSLLFLISVSIASPQNEPQSNMHDEHQDNDKHDEHQYNEKHDEHQDNDKHDEHQDNDKHDEHQDNDEHDEHGDHQGNDKHTDHDEHQANDKHIGHDGHEEVGFVKMDVKQQKMAGVKVVTVEYQQNINQIISAPGEVVNDLYNTTLLTTQVDSKVLKRQVVLGQHVKKGDLIAILYSIDIANAQNQLEVALSEWQRVKKLGKQTVGAKRFINAKADVDQNESLLLAYGFNRSLINQFMHGKQSYQAGEYPVIAPHHGVILQDNFQSGQFLPRGSNIALLVNEDNVWVEALLAPEIGQKIPVATKAKVLIGGKIFTASVIHDSHAIDEVTRTRKIRLEIENKDHLLHAGLFAKVLIELPLSLDDELSHSSAGIILLPESALMRSSDGDWTVFIEQQTGVFKQQEVELKNTINGLHHIQGLKKGQRVAIQGAFFLASEMAKGGFDPHNH